MNEFSCTSLNQSQACSYLPIHSAYDVRKFVRPLKKIVVEEEVGVSLVKKVDASHPRSQRMIRLQLHKSLIRFVKAQPSNITDHDGYLA